MAAGDKLSTQDGRLRLLLTNAATKPLNVGVPAVIIVAGLVLHVALIAIPLAVVLYAVLAAQTFFDEREARATLGAARTRALARPPIDVSQLPPELAQPLAEAVDEQQKIERAIATAGMPYGDVSAEIHVLMDEMAKVAQKGKLIHDYLADPDVQSAAARLAKLKREPGAGATADARKLATDALESQVKLQHELEQSLERCYADLEHLVASLGVIRGQIVRMSVSEETIVQDDVARQIRDLRERIGAIADGMSDAYSQVGKGD